MLAIRTLRRVSGILPLTRGFTDTSTSFLILISLSIVFVVVDEPVHSIVTPHIAHFLIQAEAGTTASTATLALVVAGKSVSARKLAATLGAGVRALACVQLGMTFQVVQTAEAGLARRAFVRLLLAVCQQMTFEVVVSSEVSGAVGALVALGRRGLWAVLVARQAHLARGGAGIVLRREGSGEGECAVARVLTRIRGNGLMLHLRGKLLRLLLLWVVLRGRLELGMLLRRLTLVWLW